MTNISTLAGAVGGVHTLTAGNAITAGDLVSVEKDGLKVMVDGRGRPGRVEQALGIMFMNLPDVNLEK